VKFIPHRQKSLPISLLYTVEAWFGRNHCERFYGLETLGTGGGIGRLALIGDTQRTSWLEFWRERNAGRTARLVAEIARRRPDAVIHLGDLTFSGLSPAHWRHFDRSHQPLRESRLPLLPIPGNHEYYGWTRQSLRNYFDRFPSLEGRLWYEFVAGRTGFALLNSNFVELSLAERESQRQWYQEVLERWRQADEVDFIVTCSHHPPYTNSRVVGASETVVREFAAPFAQHPKAAFIFSGHCHAYERFGSGRPHFVVSGGGGGPRHPLRTAPGRSRYADRYAGPPVRFFHFCELAFGPGRLDLEVVRLREDGSFDVAERVTVFKEEQPS